MNKLFILNFFFATTQIHGQVYGVDNNDNPSDYRALAEDSIQQLKKHKQQLIVFLKQNKHKFPAEKSKKMQRMIHNLTRRINLLELQLKKPNGSAN